MPWFSEQITGKSIPRHDFTAFMGIATDLILTVSKIIVYLKCNNGQHQARFLLKPKI